jgi:hypothetical protein
MKLPNQGLPWEVELTFHPRLCCSMVEARKNTWSSSGYLYRNRNPKKHIEQYSASIYIIGYKIKFCSFLRVLDISANDSNIHQPEQFGYLGIRPIKLP